MSLRALHLPPRPFPLGVRRQRQDGGVVHHIGSARLRAAGFTRDDAGRYKCVHSKQRRGRTDPRIHGDRGQGRPACPSLLADWLAPGHETVEHDLLHRCHSRISKRCHCWQRLPVLLQKLPGVVKHECSAPRRHQFVLAPSLGRDGQFHGLLRHRLAMGLHRWPVYSTPSNGWRTPEEHVGTPVNGVPCERIEALCSSASRPMCRQAGGRGAPSGFVVDGSVFTQ